MANLLLPDWAPNIHPMIVHFPIAWWIAAVIVDLIAVTLPKAAWANTTASTLYPAGAIAATATYLTGRRAAMAVLTPGMAYPIVMEHWNWALATTSYFAAIALVRLALTRRRAVPASARASAAAAGFVGLWLLVNTADRGARLVYEHGVGVMPRAQSTPAPMQTVTP
jgi:uncharacterized membrane protein